MVPLQVVDSFLLNYTVGDVLVLTFLLSVLGTLPRSRRLLAVTVTVFGLLFALTPASLLSVSHLFFGIALLVVGPMIYVTARA